MSYLFQVADALLAYNEGTTPDFLLVELRGGRLRVSVDDGSGSTAIYAPRNDTTHTRDLLDDDHWHLLELRQRGQKNFSISVDDHDPETLVVPSHDDRRNVFDMFGPLYVAGLPAHLLQSRRPHGLQQADINRFVGCLATLTVNGELDDGNASLPPSAVTGCRSKQSVLLVTIRHTHGHTQTHIERTHLRHSLRSLD